ncbi:hypothetical protein [Oceanidesulfovibrio marinus]|uniref:Uncharacterized protein n=1 Tax=Oceanidesulfovibrio marinus TaxID=370038 RepID=A0A6P1ZNP5_9BACT|nr:hypothetical protein [Oceanidesulfovibrio marinus]TVM36854.1 hypothetical protein DQK91_02730 [Oceanidesulfovibrio marinus]
MHVVDPVTKTMVIIAVLLLLGRAGEFIFTRTGVPDMVWLVLAGVVAGPVLKLVPLGILMPVLPFFGAVPLIVIFVAAFAVVKWQSLPGKGLWRQPQRHRDSDHESRTRQGYNG